MMLYDTVRREVIIGTVDFVYFFITCVFFTYPHRRVTTLFRGHIQTNDVGPREIGVNVNPATLAY
jgi:hypothetical protein